MGCDLFYFDYFDNYFDLVLFLLGLFFYFFMLGPIFIFAIFAC